METAIIFFPVYIIPNATYLQLRKVTEQVKPQIQKQDERDALLDQIRAKVRLNRFTCGTQDLFSAEHSPPTLFGQSFNLKPTATSRPSIQGRPNTNLKVAAILEKANAIRQVSIFPS